MKINSRIVSDKFENEVVVVNLENGFYYSFRNAAAEIWKMIENESAPLAGVLEAFELKSVDDERDVRAFVDFLTAERLVTETAAALPERHPEKLQYSKPQYSKFEDMADLIMIDPIHEADQKKGWPEKPG